MVEYSCSITLGWQVVYTMCLLHQSQCQTLESRSKAADYGEKYIGILPSITLDVSSLRLNTVKFG